MPTDIKSNWGQTAVQAHHLRNLSLTVASFSSFECFIYSNHDIPVSIGSGEMHIIKNQRIMRKPGKSDQSIMWN